MKLTLVNDLDSIFKASRSLNALVYASEGAGPQPIRPYKVYNGRIQGVTHSWPTSYLAQI
jgi:hypothetical protein